MSPSPLGAIIVILISTSGILRFRNSSNISVRNNEPIRRRALMTDIIKETDRDIFQDVCYMGNDLENVDQMCITYGQYHSLAPPPQLFQVRESEEEEGPRLVFVCRHDDPNKKSSYYDLTQLQTAVREYPMEPPFWARAGAFPHHFRNDPEKFSWPLNANICKTAGRARLEMAIRGDEAFDWDTIMSSEWPPLGASKKEEKEAQARNQDGNQAQKQPDAKKLAQEPGSVRAVYVYGTRNRSLLCGVIAHNSFGPYSFEQCPLGEDPR
ncbi:hypothetical protein AAE478_009410 [Parahypoxylon ruwenzoriense]